MSTNDGICVTTSPTRLRRKMHQRLQEKGILQNLKGSLRQKLISELFSNSSFKQRTESSENFIAMRMSESIIIDCLQKYGYSYTLSVFIPETGLSTNRIYSRPEIEQRLRIDNNYLISNKKEPCLVNNESCILEQIINLVEIHSKKTFADAAVQLETEHGMQLYENELRQIDRELQSKKRTNIETTYTSMEKRVLLFRQEIECELEKRYASQFQEYRRLHSDKIRQNISTSFAQRLSEKEKQLKLLYATKCEELDKREIMFKEMMENKLESSERNAYLQRQALEAEFETVRMQCEESKKLEKDLSSFRQSIFEESLKRNQKLDAMERKLLDKEQRVDELVLEEVQRLRKHDEKSLVARRTDLEVAEKKMEVESNHLKTQKKLIKSAQEDLSHKAELLCEMEIVDYNLLKQKLISSLNEIKQLQSRLAQAYEEVEKIKAAAEDASADRTMLITLRQNMERLRNQLEQERESSNSDQCRLQLQLDEMTAECQRLKQRVSLNEREMHRLRGQLADARRSFHSIKVNEDSDASAGGLKTERIIPKGHGEKKSACFIEILGMPASSCSPKIMHENEPSIAFMTSQDRLVDLERESENLEKAYSLWREQSSNTNQPNSNETTSANMNMKYNLEFPHSYFENWNRNCLHNRKKISRRFPLPVVRSMSSIMEDSRNITQDVSMGCSYSVVDLCPEENSLIKDNMNIPAPVHDIPPHTTTTKVDAEIKTEIAEPQCHSINQVLHGIESKNGKKNNTTCPFDYQRGGNSIFEALQSAQFSQNFENDIGVKPDGESIPTSHPSSSNEQYPNYDHDTSSRTPVDPVDNCLTDKPNPSLPDKDNIVGKSNQISVSSDDETTLLPFPIPISKVAEVNVDSVDENITIDPVILKYMDLLKNKTTECVADVDEWQNSKTQTEDNTTKSLGIRETAEDENHRKFDSFLNNDHFESDDEADPAINAVSPSKPRSERSEPRNSSDEFW